MADGSDLSVKFGADTKEFQAGADGVKAEFTGLRGSVQTLTDALLVLGGAATGSFREMRTGALEAHEQITGAAESVVALREAITGIGEALIAAFAVEQLVEFAKKMGEAGEKVEHTALALGMTTTEVQGLQAIANATGMSLDGVTGAAQRLERALGMAHTSSSTSINRQAAAFKQLGIDINEARTPAELFNEVVAKFAEMPPSLNKSQEAMALFGRNIAEVAPLIGLTAEQLAEVQRQTEAYNLKNDDAVTKAAALGEAFNENKNAMQGISNVMAQAFAPVLTVIVDGVNELAKAFIQSYEHGGTAKTVMDLLRIVLIGVADTVAFLGVKLYQLWEIGDAAFEGLYRSAYTFGRVLGDILTGNFVAASEDWSKGFHAAAQVVRDDMDKIQRSGKGLEEWEQRLLHPASPAAANTPPIRTTGDGLGGGTAKKAPDKWMEEQKTAFLDVENAHNQFLTNELADELAYWQKLQDMGEVPARHIVDVHRRIAELTHQLKKQELQQEVSDIRQAAADQTATINAQLRQRIETIQEEIRATQDAARQHQISWQDAQTRILGLIREEAAAQKQAALEIYTARVTADDQIKSHYAENTTEFRAMVRDEQKAWDDLQKARVAADVQANRQIQANERQALDQLRQQWHSHIDGIVQSFGSGIKGMLEGTQTFQQAMLNVADAVLSTFINIGERLVENWLVNMLTNKVASTTTAAAQVADNAAVAGAAAFASTAAIPIIGPELAPEAAAAAYGGALSFLGALAFSAERGWGEVPFDGAPTVLHKKEMVLPATIAQPLRQMVSGAGNVGPSASSGAGPMGGGDTHHHWHINAVDAKSFARLIEENPNVLKRAAQRQARNLAA
jgi:hypothetical protein